MLGRFFLGVKVELRINVFIRGIFIREIREGVEEVI